MKTVPITGGLKISPVFLVTQTNIMVNVFIVIYLLDTHSPYCDRFDFQKVEYPKEGHNFFLQFKDS